MKFSRLYIALVTAVLLGACGSDSAESSDEASRQTRQHETEESVEDANAADSTEIILFLGNSLSAGAGVDPEEAFPSLIRQRIDSLGWGFRVVNAGVSGETSSGGLRRIEWLLRQPISVLVLELGGNDGLRGIPVEVTRENLGRIIEKTRDRYPRAEIVLAGMQIPPNLGQQYAGEFRQMYPSLADEYQTHLIPFLLESVGGVDTLMQSDGIHPTEEGHQIVASNVWETLEPVLRDVRSERSPVAP